ncbi:MAG: DUF3256 family protein [Muribaculaceae bacterium]|nr:DUF3256 family protein [Muribaculaceae bacterium]
MTLSEIGKRLNQLTRKWLIPACCLAVFSAGHAAVKGNDGAATEVLSPLKVFADLPLEITEIIRPSTRLDMIDYYTQADSLLTATNALGGECRFEVVTPDYLRVTLTLVSTLEIKLLTAGKKQIVMSLYTTGGEGMARDTEVRFFDSGLQPIEGAKLMKAPETADFFSIKGSGISKADLLEKLPFSAVVYTTGPGDTPLSATFTSLDVLAQEDRDRLAPLLLPSLSTPWKGQYRFK